MGERDWARRPRSSHEVRARGWVMPESIRCVQCGICSFYCPIEIDVRRHAWRGEPVKDSHCLTCGECVARCPRGVLRFEHSLRCSQDRASIISPRR